MAKEKQLKTALFGGSFDPIHFGHIDIVKNLSARFDKVIVVPSYISPFKIDSEAEKPELRLKLLKKAFKDMPKVSVSDFELKKGGTSYSYLTAKHFAKKHENLFFVIGSEGVDSLDRWKYIDELKNLVTFYVVARPDFTVSEERVKELKKQKIKIKFAPFDGTDFSSSSIKVDMAFGRGNSFMPDELYRFVTENGMYTKYAEIVSYYDEFRMKPERIRHTYRAVKAGIRLAKQNGVSADKAVVALLLHDIGKYTSVEYCREEGWEIPAYVDRLPAKCKHAAVGMLVAKNFFGIKDDEILRAIEYHTTAATGMSRLAEVVYMADFIEDGREFDGVEEIREAAYRDIELGMELGLKNTVQHVADRSQLYEATEEAYAYYKTLNEGKRAAAKQAEEKAEAKRSVKSESLRIVPREEAEPAVTTPAPAAKAEPVIKDGNARDLAYAIAQFIDEKKGRDITVIDLDGKTIIADYFVIASATSTTAVKALSEFVDEKLSKKYKIEPLRRDIDAKWAAVDYGSVIVHIFYEETREFYQLERLWSDGGNVTHYKVK